MDYSIKSKSKKIFGFSVCFLIFGITIIIMSMSAYMGIYTNGFKKAWNKYLSNKMYEDASRAADGYCRDYYVTMLENGDYYSHYYDNYYSDDNNNFRFTYISNTNSSIPGYFHSDEKKQRVENYKFEFNIENSTVNKTFVYKTLEEVEKSEEILKANRIGLDVDISVRDNSYYVTVSNLKQERITIDLTCYIPSVYTAKDEYYMTYYSLYLIYEFRYVVIFICLVSLIVMAVLLTNLVKGAGRSPDKEEVTVRSFDRIPLEITIAILGVLIAQYVKQIAAIIRNLFIVHNTNTLIYILNSSLAGIYTIVLGFCVIEFILTVAVRAKTGRLINKTLTYRFALALVRFIKRTLNAIRSIKLFVAYLIVFGVIDFLVIYLGMYLPSQELRILLYLVVGILFINQFFLIYNVYLIDNAVNEIADGKLDYKIDNRLVSRVFRKTSTAVNRISDGMTLALKDTLKSEHFKTELITNVSHDIKTPLTSIITYVNLLNKSNVNGEEAGEYMEILEKQSEKLKKLIEDLIEASKASTGNLSVEFGEIDEYVITEQAVAEYMDRFESKGLTVVINNTMEDSMVYADGRHLWRVIDNLLNNIYKYALENTRVFIDLSTKDDKQLLTFKNISKYELNITADELTERFVRGDKSRNMEGSGLGLSISKSLTEAMNGKMYIDIDGDLYKSTIELSRPVKNDAEVEE